MDRIPDWHDESHRTIGADEVEKNLRQKRIEICDSCPEMTEFKFCSVCRCYLPVKTYFKIFKCPLGKW